MMKRAIRKTLCCTLAYAALMSARILAAGELSVADKIAFIFPGDDSGYFYAKIENTGDAPVGVDSGKLVLFSENDDILETSDYINTYPGKMILNPGEHTYVSEFLWNTDLEDQVIGDVKFSVSTTDRGRYVQTVPCEVSLDLNGSDSYDNYINITVTNEDSETRYGYYLVTALTDTAGNLIYVDKNSYEHIGLHSGSTATFGLYIDSNIVEYFETKGIEVGSVEALVYYLDE